MAIYGGHRACIDDGQRPPGAGRGLYQGRAGRRFAGHLAHHGVLGAVGGCAVGHHMASQKQKQADQQMQQQVPQNGSAYR